MKNRGLFAPLIIDYITTSGANAQAKVILRTVDSLHAQGFERVGITYSANNDQSKTIAAIYNQGEWNTATNGGNQAAVMAAVEELLHAKEFQHMQHVFRILPITTCAQAGGIGAVEDQWLDRDLENIDNFLKDGGAVLGWQNQNTSKNPRAPFAIGGGISQQLTSEQNQRVQSTLLRLMQKYIPVTKF